MDIGVMKSKLKACLSRYRYVWIVLLVGILLMLIPSQNPDTPKDSVMQVTQVGLPLEEQLANILAKVSGAGEVKVMLSLAAGEETLYQTDVDQQTQTDSTSSKRNTVTVTDSQRNESGLVRQVLPPAYMGAIIVCEGADAPSVRLAIIEAVSDVTGLGADKISVLKMK